MTKKRAMKLMMACMGGGQRNLAERAVITLLAGKLTNAERVMLFATEGLDFAHETAWTTNSAGLLVRMDKLEKRCIAVLKLFN